MCDGDVWCLAREWLGANAGQSGLEVAVIAFLVLYGISVFTEAGTGSENLLYSLLSAVLAGVATAFVFYLASLILSPLVAVLFLVFVLWVVGINVLKWIVDRRKNK